MPKLFALAVHLISMATIESCYDFCLILDNLFLKELFKYGKHVETFYIDLKFSMQLRTYFHSIISLFRVDRTVCIQC